MPPERLQSLEVVSEEEKRQKPERLQSLEVVSEEQQRQQEIRELFSLEQGLSPEDEDARIIGLNTLEQFNQRDFVLTPEERAEDIRRLDRGELPILIGYDPHAPYTEQTEAAIQDAASHFLLSDNWFSQIGVGASVDMTSVDALKLMNQLTPAIDKADGEEPSLPSVKLGATERRRVNDSVLKNFNEHYTTSDLLDKRFRNPYDPNTDFGKRVGKYDHREYIRFDAIQKDFLSWLASDWTFGGTSTTTGLEFLATVLPGEDSFTKDTDVIEWFREGNYAPTRQFSRFMEMRDWSDLRQEQYIYLRHAFENSAMFADPIERIKFNRASPEDKKRMVKPRFSAGEEWAKWGPDVVLNYFSDPIVMLSLFASMGTGGLPQYAAKLGTKRLLQSSVKKEMGARLKTAAATGRYPSRGRPAYKTKWTDPTAQKRQTKLLQRDETMVRNRLAKDLATTSSLRGWVARQAASEGLSKQMSIWGTQGFIEMGAYDIARQLTDVELKLQEEYSLAQTGLMSGLGGTIGSIGAAVPFALTKLFSIKRATQGYNILNRPKKVEKPVPDASEQTFHSSLAALDNFISKFPGKPASRFAEFYKIAPVHIKKFGERLRHDYNPRRLGSLIDLTPKEKALNPAFGTLFGHRFGQYNLRTGSIIRDLRQTSVQQKAGGKGFWDRFKKGIVEVQEKQIYWLQNGEQVPAFYDRIANNFKYLDERTATPNALEQQAIKIKQLTDRLNKNISIKSNPLFQEEKLTPQVVKAALEVRSFYRDLWKEGSNIPDLNNKGKTINLFQNLYEVKNYLPRHYNMDEVKAKQSIFEKLLIEYGHADPISTQKVVSAIEAGKDRKLLVVLEHQQRAIDKDAFTNFLNKHVADGVTARDFHHAAQIDLGIKPKTPYKDLSTADMTRVTTRAKELKARALVEQMIERTDQPFLTHVDKAGRESSFLQHRVFDNIPDEVLRNEGLIQTDLTTLLTDYAFKMSQTIERASLFGKDMAAFEQNFLNPIKRQADAHAETLTGKARTDFESQITPHLEALRLTFDVTTGLNSINRGIASSPASITKGVKGLEQTGMLGATMAHLGGATYSSVTEPMILLSKIDYVDYPEATKHLFTALLNQGRTGMLKLAEIGKLAVGRELGASIFTGKPLDPKTSTRRQIADWFRRLDDESYQDIIGTLTVAEQAMYSRIKGMFGEGITSKAAQGIQATYFWSNLLQPWTAAIQETAFQTGKSKALRLGQELATRTNSFTGLALTKNEAYRKMDMLHETGIDVGRMIKSIRQNTDKDGIFNVGQWQETPFYLNEFIDGMSMFTKEVILNPSVAEANKPLWFTNPFLRWTSQFLGYPAAFGNTVLKNFVKDLSAILPRKGPQARNMMDASRTASAILMMTLVADMTNTMRSRGAHLELTNEERLEANFRRWGGTSSAESAYKFVSAQESGGGGWLVNLLKAPLGPLPSHIFDAIAYRHNPYEIAVGFTPYWNMLTQRRRESFQKGADFWWKVHTTDEVPPMEYARGGLVSVGKDVPNVKDDPADTQIRGQRGVTYKDRAGGREKFALGNTVSVGEDVPNVKDDPAQAQIRGEERGLTYEKRAVDRDPVYSYLTENEYEDRIFASSEDSIETYSSDELPTTSNDSNFYISLPENSEGSLIDAVDRSLIGGLPVYNTKPSEGETIIQGKIKLAKALPVHLSSVTVDNLANYINRSITTLDSPLDQETRRDIVTNMNYKLGERGFALEEDANRDKDDAGEVMERSKSFVVREAILQLGFDAIKPEQSDMAYILLKTNQFLPTEILS